MKEIGSRERIKPRAWICATTVACALSGCGVQAQAVDTPGAEPTPATSAPTDSTQSQSRRNTGPVDESPRVGAVRAAHAGAVATVVWRAQPRARAVGEDCTLGAKLDRLEVAEVRYDDALLYFDVFYSEARPSATGGEESAILYLRVDGCPVTAPQVQGLVSRESDAIPSTLTIALADLPDGELDLSLRAFGSERVVSLRKTGKTVTELRDEDRAGFVRLPANPAWNLPAVALRRFVDCDKGGT